MYLHFWLTFHNCPIIHKFNWKTLSLKSLCLLPWKIHTKDFWFVKILDNLLSTDIILHRKCSVQYTCTNVNHTWTCSWWLSGRTCLGGSTALTPAPPGWRCGTDRDARQPPGVSRTSGPCGPSPGYWGSGRGPISRSIRSPTSPYNLQEMTRNDL